MDGRFKPLLSIGSRPIVLRQIDALRRARVEHIALVGRWHSEERPPAPVFADAIADAGSLGGIYTALLVAPDDATLVIAGDMPFVDTPIIAALLRRRGQADAVVPCTAQGPHPLCAWYKRSLAPAFKVRIDRGELRVRDAVAALRVQWIDAEDTVTLDADGTMLMNVNTIADYERAAGMARHRP